ncbi:TonB-dependent receptor [Bacteroides mediterraneensis]|uniref:TonB-dependent receptor n=1 Tax=Bacteroides mediterraneensis TaxID=1841856 RepID=A0ABS2EV62_9BACE|nr:carboxypeptidase regulatory-like domain-containing protein [Bacteroides mediterraneensis]MBM6758441.1 TonB-dependent receptor [Bacteroides mediterraneensis]
MVHHSKFLFSAFVVSAMAVGANAQVTTSAISGKVLDETKAPVIGATVVAIHEPSGTLYGAVTNVDGRYTIQGMRTGGPYKIEISYVGYNKTTYTGISLELGNTLSLNAEMKPSSELLDEVVVVADAKANAGAAHNFSTQKIENTPTVDRNVYDIVKNMPMAMTSKNGGITFAGSNNRYNSFQIDGTVSNDVFGLSASGTNGGQTGANPISMDAIQEIQVVVAPFDVRQSGFTGGGINAITKQGTNTTHGSAYTYFNNQNMYGKYSAVRGYEKSPLNQQYTRTYGGTLGGAIVKDKLFYFVSAEAKKESYPSSVYPGYTDSYITNDVAKQIADQYAALTGIQEGYGQPDIENKSFGLLARIDWNINQNHKLALRYQHNNSYDDNYSLGSTTYTFNNSGYRMNNKTNSIVAELNSHLGQNLYNELRASASFIRDHRNVGYQGPTVQIKNVKGADGKTGVTVNIGTEYSSGANYLDQDIYTVEDNLSWYLGNHTLTFGTHNEIYRMKNLFIQAVNGSWYYNSLDLFLQDKPYQYSYKYTDPELTGGDTRWAPAMKSGQFGFYAQDKWDVSTNFNLTYGLRIDIPVIFNNPTENPTFNEYAAQQGFNVRVGENPSAKVLFSPRVGFRWYTNDSHNTLLRGGVGIFTGRVPFVWLSNAFNNTGMESKGTTLGNKDNKNNWLNDAPALGQYANDPMGAANSQTGTSAKPDIVTVSKDFKYPQVFRANLAWEQKLPGDVKMTLEGVYSKTMNNVFFENLAAVNTGEKVYAIPGVEASAAPKYNNTKSNYYSIVNLKNTNKGYTYALSALLEKHFNFGLDLSASYTFGHAKSVNDGTSSVAYSNWKYNYSVDTNSPNELGFSKFDIPHRVMIQASYSSPKYWNGWTSTTISVIYNGFSGSRYSLTMNDKPDFNGDGYPGNSLLYIPTDEELSKMIFTSVDKDGKALSMTAEQSRDAFKQWIENDSYAKNHRGQYAERNSNLSNWEHEIDLHLAQTIYNVQGVGKLEFTFDIINFANMLNKKWGASYESAYNLSPLTLEYFDKNTGNAAFSYNKAEIQKSDISSRWHCQVGVRLTF